MRVSFVTIKQWLPFSLAPEHKATAAGKARHVLNTLMTVFRIKRVSIWRCTGIGKQVATLAWGVHVPCECARVFVYTLTLQVFGGKESVQHRCIMLMSSVRTTVDRSAVMLQPSTPHWRDVCLRVPFGMSGLCHRH